MTRTVWLDGETKNYRECSAVQIVFKFSFEVWINVGVFMERVTK